MFYANLRYRRNLFALVLLDKGVMITIEAIEFWGRILGVPCTRIKLYGETFDSLNWNIQHAIFILCEVRDSGVFRFDYSFPIKLLTPRARLLVKIAQFNFLPQGGHFNIVKMETLLLMYIMFTYIEINLLDLLLHSILENNLVFLAY